MSDLAPLHIRVDNLEGAQIRGLLEAHLELMYQISPPESVHALPVDGLKARDVTTYTAWREDQLMGCGALKELSAEHGEIKAMHTAQEARGAGVGTAILRHLLRVARERGYERLSLETGTQAEFGPAVRLYERHGFEPCGPFGDYSLDPNSQFMTLSLRAPS